MSPCQLHAGLLTSPLQSIDLTRIPNSSAIHAKSDVDNPGIFIDYSAREVAPPALLLQQLLRAHQVFLLHQAPSLADLWGRVTRQRFCYFLKRFWDNFIWGWDVLLHGSPAIDIYNGLKLSAGGELGIGVGEEEWGSGEREVLEGFIDRTDGLVDMVVSRFGVPIHGASNPNAEHKLSGGYGAGEYPGPSDGVLFSGVEALTRSSIRDISTWMEWLYIHGEAAYGVRDNPSSSLRRKRKKPEQSANSRGFPGSVGDTRVAIPAPIVPAPKTPKKESSNAPSSNGTPPSDKHGSAQKVTATGTETFVKYLTLGVYGSHWGIPSGKPPVNEHLSNVRGDNEKSPLPRSARSLLEPEQELSNAYFLVGLLGELEEGLQDEVVEEAELDTDREHPSERSSSNNRIVMRTVHVERKRADRNQAHNDFDDRVEGIHFDKLRIVVYVQEPFIFAFLFELQTDTLAIPSFYRSLHHQLGPLQRPLLTSTSPSKVSERLWEAASPRSTDASKSTQPISDLVFDPARLSVHTTIPNIPEPGSAASPAIWSRAEAMTVHSQILNTHASTRRHTSEMERTCKTSRGWWVVWMRLPRPQPTLSTHSSSHREAFLIRKASDYTTHTPRKSSGRYVSSSSNDSLGWASPSRLAEGIGIDARQYIEGLLSLNR